MEHTEQLLDSKAVQVQVVEFSSSLSSLNCFRMLRLMKNCEECEERLCFSFCRPAYGRARSTLQCGRIAMKTENEVAMRKMKIRHAK